MSELSRLQWDYAEKFGEDALDHVGQPPMVLHQNWPVLLRQALARGNPLTRAEVLAACGDGGYEEIGGDAE